VAHKDVGPEIALGWVGAVPIAIGKVCDGPVPHAFDGVTVNVPAVVAANEIEFPDPVIVPVPE
jgi:hypothetical protein